MKRLYLVRHAKSSWKEHGVKDHNRPLNKRGMQDAPFMGQRLAEHNVKPDVLISSSAKRALKTARIIADKITYDSKKIIVDESIYLADVSTLVEVIRNIDDLANEAMLFGHNPGFTYLAYYLTGLDVHNIPTCGIFCVDFDLASWHDVHEHSGHMVFFDFPKKNL